MFRFSGVCMEVPTVESLKWMNIDIIMPVCIVAVIRTTVMIGDDFTQNGILSTTLPRPMFQV